MSFEPFPHKITLVKNYTEDVKLFRVKTTMNPLPGQFFEVSLLGFGEAPLASCSFRKDYVDMVVRNAGNVTNAMFEKLKKNDIVHIRGPYGNGYNLKELEGKNIILISGGTGVAPITSLIEYLEQNRSKFKEIIIYFAYRDEKSILLKERIEKWSKVFKTTVLLGNNSNKKYETGKIGDLILKQKPSIKDTISIMCGPEPMMENAVSTLNKLGLTNDKIYWNMERRMECAIGSCGRCLIQDVYVCRDGPVFRYDQIKQKLENESSK